MENIVTPLEQHYLWNGKIEVVSRVPLETAQQLAAAYTPGVAQPCLAIKDNVDLSYELTRRFNTVAVITDGTAVLGLGDIGPEAGMPVMEGKCVLFKEFGGIDAIPLCVRSKEPDDIVRVISLLAGSFGGINLEDISAPRCFEIERKLKQACDIPIFHDDQHGTAVVTLAGLINALKLVNKRPGGCSVVISGAGAAGTAIALLLKAYGFEDIVLVNRKGAVSMDQLPDDGSELSCIAAVTNPHMKKGSLSDVMVGADIFLGVSAPNIVSGEMVASMNRDPIVFAMANPIPEIMPDVAKRFGATIVGTGRSDFPNQINNVLAFPGIFRGALDVRASDINDEMKLAAAVALAGVIHESALNEEYFIPSPFDKRVCNAVASGVAKAAISSGVARIDSLALEASVL